MENIRELPEGNNFVKLYICLIAAALAAAVWIGLELPAQSGLTVGLLSPARDGKLLSEGVKLLLPEILTAALLTFPSGKVFSSFAAAFLFAFHGVAAGHTVRYCVVNSVDAAAIGVCVSYAALTLMFYVYAVFMREGNGTCTNLFRLLCYFTVSGAAIILRIVPFLFI